MICKAEKDERKSYCEMHSIQCSLTANALVENLITSCHANSNKYPQKRMEREFNKVFVL